MAAKHKNIFTRNKPLMNIYNSVDHEGKEVEVREDAEQLVKWHEIMDALVAAGYYRAQLQGLSAFDKIVGGLTWCIELCDIDVDVSLLFEENLTIGKKIALTERIVNVLRSLKCPYAIEPHQIQGLDFIKIQPLVQWLIKYSSEFRQAKEEELRKFAVMQYEKDHIFESDRSEFEKKEALLRNIAAVQNMYKPCRVRRRKGSMPSNELEQVNATLSEYDQRTLLHISTSSHEKKDECLDFLYDTEKTLADPSEITTKNEIIKTEDKAENEADTKVHYAVLQSELTGEVSKELEESEKLKYSEDVARLTKAIETMEKEVEERKQEHEGRMESAKKQYSDVTNKLRKLTFKLLAVDDYSDNKVKEFYKSLKELAQDRNELLQLIEQREKEHKKLEEELKAVQHPDAKIEDTPLTPGELKEFRDREQKLKDFISNMRLELAALNREVQRYSVAVDEVPGAAELLQYEKRFIELYDQVASKHKETKQYYIFYNTLYEVKLYTSKELSLLNSILDNYEESEANYQDIRIKKYLLHSGQIQRRRPKDLMKFKKEKQIIDDLKTKKSTIIECLSRLCELAMSSARKREEFMTQFESIVEWVNQTVKKVEQKYKSEREQKAVLHCEYSRLMEIQRQYAAALKRLAEGRQRYGRQPHS